MRKFLSLTLAFFFALQFTMQNANGALSLSGDNWKDPLRTKTWTPPLVSDELVGKTAAQDLTNKIIDGDLNTLLNLPVNLAGGKVTGQLPVANGDANFVTVGTFQNVGGDKRFEGELNVTGNFKLGSLVGILRSTATGVLTTLVDLTSDITGYLPWFRGGNGNLIKNNASFEISPVTTGWTCSAITPTRDATASVDGSYGITFTASATVQGCLQYFDVPQGSIGSLLEYSIYIQANGDVEVCSINGGSVSKCSTYIANQSTGLVKITVTDRPIDSLSNNNGILWRTKTATTTTVKADKAYAGSLQSAEAVMAKFQADSKRIRIGNATSYITADTTNPTFGTLTVNDLFVTRKGDRALVEYKIKQNTAGTNGSGIYRYALPIIDGVQLKAPQYFKIASANAGIQCTQSGTVFALDSFVRSYVSDYQFMVAGININNNTGAFSTSSTVHSSGAYNFGACTTLEIDIVLDVYVPEWSDSYNAALAVCEKGPIGCGNVYTAMINGTTPSVINANKAGWITSVTRSATGNFTLNLSPLLRLTVPMNCTANGTTASYAEYETFPNSTTTSIQVSQGNHLPTTNQVASNANFSIICVKNAPDYSESFEKFAGYLPMNDVKSTEWVVGYDWIDNKPIYKRCYKVPSDISTDGATIVSMGTNLNPIAPNFGSSTNEWTIFNGSTSAGYYAALYNKTTGALRSVLSGGYIIGAGSKFCMEYTK